MFLFEENEGPSSIVADIAQHYVIRHLSAEGKLGYKRNTEPERDVFSQIVGIINLDNHVRLDTELEKYPLRHSVETASLVKRYKTLAREVACGDFFFTCERMLLIKCQKNSVVDDRCALVSAGEGEIVRNDRVAALVDILGTVAYRKSDVGVRGAKQLDRFGYDTSV